MLRRPPRSRDLLALALALPICGCGAGDGEGDPLGLAAEAIVFGEPDTEHDAVVALLGDKTACSATIVEVRGSYGYALTAAHCVVAPPRYVVRGEDYAASGAVFYPVVAYEAHASYDAETWRYDFAMVRFAGASEETPVLRAMGAEEDDLAVGSKVTFVGYGRTEKGGNSRRMRVGGVLSELDATEIRYDQPDGGPCNGDSGGPALRLVSGEPLVAGVTSHGDESCTAFGASARTSAVASSFVEPFALDFPAEPETCRACIEATTNGDGACAPEVSGCREHAGCRSYLDCLDGCSGAACEAGCETKYPAGAAKFDEIFVCVCEDGCASTCGESEQVCPKPRACGLVLEKAACASCAEGACCAEAEACADAEGCGACLGDPTLAGCADLPEAGALFACLRETCASACPGLPPEPEAEEETEEPDAFKAGEGAAPNGALAGVVGCHVARKPAGTSERRLFALLVALAALALGAPRRARRRGAQVPRSIRPSA